MFGRSFREPEQDIMKLRSFAMLLVAAVILATIFQAYLSPEMALMAVNWVSMCF